MGSSSQQGTLLLTTWRIALVSFVALPIFVLLQQWTWALVCLPLIFAPIFLGKSWIDFEYIMAPSNVEILLHSFLSSITKRPNIKGPRPTIKCSARIKIGKAEFQKFCKLSGFDNSSLEKPGLAAVPFLHAASITNCGSIVAHPAFPFPALGLIHIRNQICLNKEVTFANDGFDISACISAYTETDKGIEISFVVDIVDPASKEHVCQTLSTLLYKCKTSIAKKNKVPKERVAEDSEQTIEWSLPGSTGMQYATCSGDYNPIHLHPLSAKLLGQKTSIAHGMFTLSKAMADTIRLTKATFPLAYPVNVINEWKLPLVIPSKSSLHCNVVSGEDSGYGLGPRSMDGEPVTPKRFASFLLDFDGGKPHNVGAIWSSADL
eukprot:m.39453 g.39453  ORF g.39453 m.39453 type:complete len:377 (+) comp11607_c0_seq1:424-1554(+)